MPLWNVKASVVELVTANDREQAVRKLKRMLDRDGYTLYDGDPVHAFVSEPVED